MNKSDLKQKDILKFWRDVEIFDLPSFDNEARILNEKEILPWNNTNRTVKKNYKWRYTLIFGKIDKTSIVNHLNDLLGITDSNDWETPVTGASSLSALMLNENGQIENEEYMVSSYLLGIKALEKNRHLSTIPKAIMESKNDFYERYNLKSNNDNEDKLEQEESISWDHLLKEIAYVSGFSEWSAKKIDVYVLEKLVPKDSEGNLSLFNSFYLDDLNYLSGIEEDKLGQALQSYLHLNPLKEKREDLIGSPDYLFQSIAPRLMSAGRWPSNIAHGLYTAQLGAVNTIFANLREQRGLQGVNGPPGTGKTTLLKDIIAEVIVERAKVISALGCHNIFDSGNRIIEQESGFNLYTYPLNKALRNNFGIVVASNNNAAVENISKELPLKSKIDIKEFPNADYFSDFSQNLIQEESWGVLAAALGNSKNRSSFRQAFWKANNADGEPAFHDFLYSLYKDAEDDQAYAYMKSFDEKNSLFMSLLNEFEAFKKLASSFHTQLPKYINNKKIQDSTRVEANEIAENLHSLKEEEKTINALIDQIEEDVNRLQDLIKLQTVRKPLFFFFHKLFQSNKFKQWNLQAEELMNDLNSRNLSLKRTRDHLSLSNAAMVKLMTQEANNKKVLASLEQFFLAYEILQDELSSTYGIEPKNLFNSDMLQKDLNEIQLLNPYHSAKIAKLRSDIFITALQLHHDAILANAKKIKNNLNAYFMMSSGWVKVESDMAQNLWDTFFLCVPVVSTTLASASRLFANLNTEQIGWLLVDEAGQATPQSVAGLIHRSKRCIIVGDPLQVEPVVTIPENLVTKLRQQNNVHVDWSPCKTSVQQLADRVSLAGTYMQVGNSEEKIWTGFPLRTHRRCDEPMFSIANHIAYGNQMVKAIKTNSEEEFIGPSTWFHIETTTEPQNKHVIVEEITFLRHKISRLIDKMDYKGHIYVISPFKSVADYCKNEFKQHQQVFCGTIHTFQGKEADIVFLVLGSDPKSSGARNWASQKPNMLNVALTRAQKRFYVIGNKKLWATCDYFSTMAKDLQ
ncbi:AAA domain-containing protein [Sphingobacterium sp. SG20118]|uniref:AAA domain-containing protein n=1 Tax=Sphingobacterium sp. SG20118 TaxID=3367156 RepID=UPI0037DFC410